MAGTNAVFQVTGPYLGQDSTTNGYIGKRAFQGSLVPTEMITAGFRRKVAAEDFRVFGRGERIRTSDLSVPNRAHYQAVLRPVLTYKFAIDL